METPNLTVLQHRCDQCEREFKSRPALSMHKIRKHSGKKWNSNPKPTRKKKAYRLPVINPLAAVAPDYQRAAEAIINAANVLRSVAVGMRIQ